MRYYYCTVLLLYCIYNPQDYKTHYYILLLTFNASPRQTGPYDYGYGKLVGCKVGRFSLLDRSSLPRVSPLTYP